MNTFPHSPDGEGPAYQTRAISELIDVEPIFFQVVTTIGAPPAWRREPGFPTIIRIILEQQVSLASAKAAFDRLVEAAGEVTPESFLVFKDDELKQIGFSRQKIAYGRNLANALLTGVLDLQHLADLDDNQVHSVLTAIKGIGVWTANIYLLMVLDRPDIWPQGDIALAAAYRQLKGLSDRPTNSEMEQISNSWRPWRSVAARMLWHYYLSRPDH